MYLSSELLPLDSFPSERMTTLFNRMRFSAGFGVGVGTVLALGGPAQSFHSNIGSKALLFQGTYVMPASGQTCTRGEHGALRHGRGTVIEEEAGGLWHAAGERDRRSRWLKR